MAQVLVRNLEEHVIEALKVQARLHHRSLQSEIKGILEVAADHARRVEAFRSSAARLQASFDGKIFANGSELIREDRER
jgi:plasmid stability protein